MCYGTLPRRFNVLPTQHDQQRNLSTSEFPSKVVLWDDNYHRYF